MKFEPMPLSEAKGKILAHNIAGSNGQRLLRKGKPLTRGIQAALPHIDHFLPVHNLASLEDLANRLVNLERRPNGGTHARYSVRPR